MNKPILVGDALGAPTAALMANAENLAAKCGAKSFSDYLFGLAHFEITEAASDRIAWNYLAYVRAYAAESGKNGEIIPPDRRRRSIRRR